jgi:hypothetical protein
MRHANLINLDKAADGQSRRRPAGAGNESFAASICFKTFVLSPMRLLQLAF